jgi:hypothetical protein
LINRFLSGFERNKSLSYILLLLTLLSVIFRVWVSTPNWMHYDENYYLNIAQNFVDRGQLTPYMWRLGDTHIISGGGSGYAILILIGWLRLVQFSLFWGRMFSVAAGLLTAFIIYKVASLWWNSRTAGLAALAFSLASTSPFYTLILKMDAIGILTYSAVLLLFLIALSSNRRWLHFCVGLAAVAAAEFHVLAILYLFAFSAYYGICFLEEVLSKRRLVFTPGPVFFAIGAALAGSLYLAVHVLPDPKAYFIIPSHCFECTEPIYLTELKRVLRLLYLRPMEVAIFLLAVVSAFSRHKPEDRCYLIFVAAYLVAQAVSHTPPYMHYTNHFWPLIAIGAAGFVARGFDGLENKRRFNISIMVAFLLLFSNLLMHLVGFHPYLIANELTSSPAVDTIQREIPTNTVVMGKVPAFYQLRAYKNFLSYRDGSVYGALLRQESMLTFWNRVQPQVILLNPDDFSTDPELKQYMAQHHFIQRMDGLYISGDLKTKTAPASTP